MELSEEIRMIPEGDYTATFLAYETGITKSKRTPFAKMQFNLMDGRPVWSYVSLLGTNIGSIILWALPRLIGQQCKIRIRHRERDDNHTYYDVAILQVF